MNRELKFRLWNIEDKVWDNPALLEVFNDDGTLEPYEYSVKAGELNPLYIPKENYVIQQYTGLKDKNGQEIYDGDVIKVDTFDSNDKKSTITESVVWGEYGDDEYVDKLECWMMGGYPLSSVAKSWGVRYNASETESGSLEVVGNIFENPEMIK